MAYTIKKTEIIDYSPASLKDFELLMYEYIDNLHFTLNPKECLKNADEYIAIAKERFLKSGWAGDGNIELIWVPPFMLKDQNGKTLYWEKTKGIIVWHVKQESDGISWLLIPSELKLT
ncbi:hypothetical protein [uncultured Aquimarina sp.]|uniref:hypothetical protein n=1 Tax=uncultured Aquimarina sp. TaxID=575652 RepID=UPI00262AC8A8|nr:hypothetical protein [uncultured Aquimarina sp.]